MHVRLGCIIGLLAASTAFSQTPAGSAPTTPPLPPSPAIRTGTQLVVVDVVVQDSAGRPVRNLPRDAFHVLENKGPQTVSAFEEHSDANPPQPGPELPKLPPGTFTDYTPVPASGALNVILIDALNTPIPDQSYLREQLKDYVNKAKPGSRVAIFGLNTRLYLLQGFTSNLETLKDAVNHKLIPRASHLMDDPTTGAEDTSMSEAATNAGATEVATNLQQFEAMQESFKLQMRTQYTLDAFNALAHYLSAFPGRKNLLWFSGSFPINVYPDATLANPFSVMQVNDDEFRETTNLLTRSEVAVYPIDARGLMVQPAFSAANSGSQYARNPQALAADLNKFSQSQAQEHMTMDQMASDTGGRAYYNTNGLAAAAANAMESGANYYTLAYTPTDRNQHGEYRSIHLDLSGAQPASGLKLYYRHGYYADVPARNAKAGASALTSPQATVVPAPVVSAAYSKAAMLHGAPMPEDLLFKVRVLPVSPTTDSTLSPDDQPDPANPFKGPYRRYQLDFAALGSQIRVATQPNGTRTGALEFKAFVYDSEGKLLNVNDRTVQLTLTPETYKHLVQSGLGMRMIVSAPGRGEAFLRLAVHDVSTNRYGVVEIPTSSVARLSPPTPVQAPAAPAAGSPAPSPVPQTPK